MTVIDRQMIDASGAREIPELFRLVPGFIVGYHDGHTPSVSYHLSLDRYAKRMQVLIDGRSVYTTAIGAVPWATLHITIDDIEHIEVVRGPNSASYGANSFLGVINIITRHAVLDHGTTVKTNIGDKGVREYFLRHGGSSGKLDYRFGLGLIEDDGFDDRLDYKRTSILSFRGDYNLNPDDIMSVQLGLGVGPRGVENRHSPELSREREKTVMNHHQHIKWERSLGVGESVALQFYHIFQRNFEKYWISDIVLASDNGIDLVLDPVQVDFSRRTERYDLELQHNVTVSETVRLGWGGGLRQDKVWGGLNLMLDEEFSNDLAYGFVNAEWNPANAWLMNGGFMVEDYSTTGTHVSPRLGVNYHMTPNQALRLTGSQAIRAPSMFEYAATYALYGTSSYTSNGVEVASGPDILDEFWLGTQNAEVEKMTSYEFGYHVRNEPRSAVVDLKLFRDEIRDLINLERVSGADVDGVHQEYVNFGAFIIEGVEVEGRFSLHEKISLHLGYAYTVLAGVLEGNEDTYEKTAPQNSLSLLYMHQLPRRYSMGIG